MEKNIMNKSKLIRSFIAITLISSMMFSCLTSIGAEISMNKSIFSSRQLMNEKTRTAPPNTVRVSITSDGGQLVYDDPGPYSKGAQEATITPNGRFVVFTSYANNLPGYNGQRQVYVHDRDLDENGVYDEVGSGKVATVLISKNTRSKNFGDAGNDVSGGFIPSNKAAACVGAMKMVISSNGRFVCFVSKSTNFYEGMSIHETHVYLHDRDADIDGIFDEENVGEISTELIDKKIDDTWFYDAGWPVISDDLDCTYVAFCGQYNQVTDPLKLYIVNRAGGSFAQVELPSGYMAPKYLSMTPDANFIAFTSSNCAYSKICRYDRISNEITIEVSAAETWHSCFWPSISTDGKVIAFTTGANSFTGFPPLNPPDTNNKWDVFVWDAREGAPVITRVSISSSGVQGNDNSGGSSYDPDVSLSPDGNYVAFWSYARNLIDDGVDRTFTGIYLRNRLAGTTELVSVNSAGQDPGSGSFTKCLWPSVSFDGRYIAFNSNSPILAPEGDTNEVIDVFVRNHIACSCSILGDVNGDGILDFGDINPFVLALTNPGEFYTQYPNGNWWCADINQDGIVDFGDINPFVALFSGGG